MKNIFGLLMILNILIFSGCSQNQISLDGESFTFYKEENGNLEISENIPKKIMDYEIESYEFAKDEKIVVLSVFYSNSNGDKQGVVFSEYSDSYIEEFERIIHLSARSYTINDKKVINLIGKGWFINENTFISLTTKNDDFLSSLIKNFPYDEKTTTFTFLQEGAENIYE